MDMNKIQEIVDGFIPEIRKELMSDVHAAMTQTKDQPTLSGDDLACLLESVIDASLKASAALIVQTLSKVA